MNTPEDFGPDYAETNDRDIIWPLPEQFGSGTETHEEHRLKLHITGLTQNDLIQRVETLESRIRERIDDLEERVVLDVVRTAPHKYPRRLAWPAMVFVTGLAGLGTVASLMAVGETITIRHDITVQLQREAFDRTYHDSRDAGKGRSPPSCIACVYPPRGAEGRIPLAPRP